MPYQNPVIPGFYPDPSVCRVDEDYYLVTSSFEYFPGVPVLHSKDLIHWRQIGHGLTRESQLPLHGTPSPFGIWAPTIRHHDGLFYLTTTNMPGHSNFYVTATDPAGPWSEPIAVDQGGIDPTIFFDDDGRAYYVTNAPQLPDYPLCAISLSEIDIATGARLTDVRLIWGGTGGSYPEAPHIYKIDAWYYLLIAEGGTSFGHMVTIARSRTIWGPYDPCPQNPILSHAHLPALPIQCTGHGDLVQAHDGSWWMVFLATRPVAINTQHLGRETYLAPVTWEEGWPVVNGGRPIALDMDVPTLPLHPWPELPARDDFDAPILALSWNYLRNPLNAHYDLTSRPGWLRLHGTAVTLNDIDSPTFIGRRQQHVDGRASALFEFMPAREGEEAGLTVLMTHDHHFDLGIRQVDGQPEVFVRRRLRSLNVITATAPLAPGPVNLAIIADSEQYAFTFRQGDNAWQTLDTPEPRYLAAEVARTFTGVYLGLYAVGGTADVDWFEYSH